MARQYNIDGLSFEVDLRFLVHSLVVETDEDGHIYYDEKKHQIKTKIDRKSWFYFHHNYSWCRKVWFRCWNCNNIQSH